MCSCLFLCFEFFDLVDTSLVTASFKRSVQPLFYYFRHYLDIGNHPAPHGQHVGVVVLPAQIRQPSGLLQTAARTPLNLFAAIDMPTRCHSTEFRCFPSEPLLPRQPHSREKSVGFFTVCTQVKVLNSK